MADVNNEWHGGMRRLYDTKAALTTMRAIGFGPDFFTRLPFELTKTST